MLQKSEDTVDALFGGKIRIVQSRKGHRISLDSVLLAHFISVRAGERIMDLGSGNGVLPLILAFLYPSLSITGVELQEAMVGRATRGVRLNRVDSRVTMTCLDVCAVPACFAPESFDAVICNPPYRRSSSGRLSPDSEKRIARHETRATLEDFVRSAAHLLPLRGRLALIYSAVRCVDLLTALRSNRIEPKRLRMVHSFAAAGASMVLVEGVKGGKPGIEILAPLVVYDREGHYTAEVKRQLSGKAMSGPRLPLGES